MLFSGHNVIADQDKDLVFMWSQFTNLPALFTQLLNISYFPGYDLDSIHEAADPVEAVQKSEAIFIGKLHLQYRKKKINTNFM